jgi:transposase-like protein
MDRREFQAWLSAAETLTKAQKAEAVEVLAGLPGGTAALAAIEFGVAEERHCPHCGTPGAVARGYARGLRRYHCKGCGKTFGALTGTPLSGLHHKERWLDFGQSLAVGETVRESAERCDVAVSTAFRWRHRFLGAVKGGASSLRGIVEADETFVLAQPQGGAQSRPQAPQTRRQGPEARPLARAGAGPGGGRPFRRHRQRRPAGGQCRGSPGGFGAGHRKGRPAGLRRLHQLPALRRRPRHQP